MYLSPFRLLAKDNIAFVITRDITQGNAQKQNFAPRFGFAYQPNTKIVVHGGFGLFYGGYENYGLSASPPANFPFNIATSYSAGNSVTPLTPDNSIGAIRNGLLNVPLSSANANLTNISLLGRQYNWKSAYSEAYNLQVQYQLSAKTVLKVAYAGSVSRHLQVPINTNTVNTILPATANAQANSFFPELPLGHSQKYLTQGIASAVAGGWSVQWIATVQDGQPFTLPCSVTTAAGLGCNALKVQGMQVPTIRFTS